MAEFVTVNTWRDPRSTKMHTRISCGAVDRLWWKVAPESLKFPDWEAVREWHSENCLDPDACRWCFPAPRYAKDDSDIPF
jgi:hypothetical protein